MIQSVPIPMGGQLTNKRIITTAEALPKEQRSEPHISFPSLGVLHWEKKKKNLGVFGFENQQGLHIGESENCGK